MAGPNRKTVRGAIAAALLVLAAAVCRIVGRSEHMLFVLGLVRSGIYIGLFTAWGVSVRRRIVQVQARRYLAAIAALMVFWLAVRTAKYSFAEDPDTARGLWYLYYAPMLFIPLLSVFAAMSLGRPEGYSLRRWTALLYIPTAALLLLVLTNDAHQLVFSFPAGAEAWTDHSYGYAPAYFLVAGWEVVCALTAFVVMAVRCRVPRSRKRLWLPLLPLAAALVYGALYVSGAVSRGSLVYLVAGDLTVTLCLLITAAYEAFIQCGLIQSNTHYGELFRVSTVRAQITDGDYSVLLSSDAAQSVPQSAMRRTETAPVLLAGGARPSGAPIRDGHVLWTEDVAELLDVLEQLRDAQEQLEDDNSLLIAEYALKARQTHAEEQNRLYNVIQQRTRRQIGLLAELTDEFESSADETRRRKLLCRMLVIGAYLKRRSNLIFLAGRTPILDPRELELAFRESMDNLELCGLSCGFRMELTRPLPAEQIAEMYDFFEDVTERSIDSASAVLTVIGETESGACLSLSVDAAADLSVPVRENAAAERDEDGEWRLVLRVGGGV